MNLQKRFSSEKFNFFIKIANYYNSINQFFSLNIKENIECFYLTFIAINNSLKVDFKLTLRNFVKTLNLNFFYKVY